MGLGKTGFTMLTLQYSGSTAPIMLYITGSQEGYVYGGVTLCGLWS